MGVARTLATLALTAALLAGCSDDESSAATLRGPLEYTREGGGIDAFYYAIR